MSTEDLGPMPEPHTEPRDPNPGGVDAIDAAVVDEAPAIAQVLRIAAEAGAPVFSIDPTAAPPPYFPITHLATEAQMLSALSERQRTTLANALRTLAADLGDDASPLRGE